MRLAKTSILFLSLMLPVQSFAAEKLVFAIDLIRHGDRTPIITIPTSQNVWKEGSGQLTTLGMQQEYNLGVALRQRYVEKEHLLPRQYQAGTLYVRSTDVDRTLMSAESLLMGLYPAKTNSSLPFAMQPIPVHTAPQDVDTIIDQKIDKKALASALQKYVYDTTEWKQKEAELKPYFQHWSEATGIKINTLQDLMFADTIYINKLHHMPQPAGLTDDDINTILNADEFASVLELKAAPVAALYQSQLVRFIADTLQQQGNADNAQTVKYALLSAHDVTIACVMTLLDVPLQKIPDYASDLNFSLYESNKNYIVRVTYNGDPVSIPACGGTECTLQQFVKAANHYTALGR